MALIPHSVSINSYFQYENVVVCKLNGKNDHILNTPKILPCGNTACFECILMVYNYETQEFKCSFPSCHETHVIKDVASLKTNLIAEDAVKDNLETLTKNVFERLHQAYKEAKSSMASDKINSIFSTIESDIVARVGVIQKELQKLQQDLVHIVKDFKENFVVKAQKEFKHEEGNYLRFSKQMNERISATSKSSKQQSKTVNALIDASLPDTNGTAVTLSNDETLRKNLLECEMYLKQMSNFSCGLKEKLNNIQFKVADDWSPDSSIIGKLHGTSITKFLMKLVHNKPKVINFDNESVHGICNLFDEHLLVTCVDTNKLLLVDKNYNIVKQVSQIGELTLNCPLGVCHNNKDSIYVCDLMNHRVLILDRQLNLKKIIGDTSHTNNLSANASSELGKFDRPVDTCFYAGNLYVLDCRNKRVQEFDADGAFKREIKLVKIAFDVDKRASLLSTDDNAFHKRPLRLDVNEDTIAVIDDYEELFIYNFAGDLKQMIKKCRLMCFVDTFLFTCDDHGLLTCYEKCKINGGTEEYLSLFKRKIEILQPPISFMRFFNGHLTISLGGSKLGIAIF